MTELEDNYPDSDASDCDDGFYKDTDKDIYNYDRTHIDDALLKKGVCGFKAMLKKVRSSPYEAEEIVDVQIFV